MPKPLDPAKREAILRGIRSGDERSAGSIAREHGVARSTVMKIATDEGIDDAFDRTKTKTATRAKTADNASRRAELAAAMLDDVDFLRAKFRQDWTKTVVVPGIGERTVEADTAEVATGLQRLMTAIGIATDKHLVLEKHDAADESGGAAVDTWLRNILGKD